MYVDGLILRADTTLLWQFDGGYVDLDANGTATCWNYYVTDHLGSTRMVVSSSDSIRETVNYYPFGSEMRMEVPAQMTNSLGHPFRFTGKELDKLNGLNMYDFGARWFDVAGVPMWTSVDPLAEKYYSFTPYSYCMGDPVNLFDPLGEEPTAKEAAYMADHIYDENKELIGGWHQYYRNTTSNGLQYGIYEREMKNGEMEYVLAFAGTNDIDDVQQDLSQFFNTGAASQYGNAVTLGRKFASYYDGYEKTIVGHSLGGGLATAASMATDIPAVTFNPAAMTEYTKSQLGIQNSNGANITNYVVTGEPLSVVQNKSGMNLPGNTNYIDVQETSNNPFVNSYNAHKISTIKKVLTK